MGRKCSLKSLQAFQFILFLALAALTVTVILIWTSVVKHAEHHIQKALHKTSIQLLTSNIDKQTMKYTRLSCDLDHDPVAENKTYEFSCFSIDSVGDQLNLVLAFPNKDPRQIIHELNRVAWGLIAPMLVLLCLVTFVGVNVFFKGHWREMALRASLVKQKEATQQAERKAVNKSMAFANASHDVRTSLAAISGLIELCRKDIGLQAELEESLKQMESCATDLMGILNAVLDASKLEAGKTTLNDDEFNIAQVLEEVVDMFHVVGFQKGLEVILDPCDGSISKWSLVKGDCRRLKQIMWNLLNNAVKFTSEGHILVRARAKKPTLENHILSNANHNFRLFDQRSWMSKMFSKGDGKTGSTRAVKSDPDLVEFVIEVDDTGSGIPKEKKKSVFENFVQLKKSGYDGPEGTGLGLGLVQSYVRLMGGDISIIDKEPGEEGACFRFNIFLRMKETQSSHTHSETESQQRFRTTPPTNPPKLEKIHAVLFVRGEETRRISRDWLSRLGVKVWPVTRSEQLVQILNDMKRKLSSKSKSVSLSPDVYSSRSASGNSHTIDIEEESTSSVDVAEHSSPLMGAITTDRHKAYRSKGAVRYLVILVDMSCDPFAEMCSILANFTKGLPSSRYRIVWLAAQNTPSADLKSLRDRQAPCDLVLKGPFHGSRLDAVLRLLREFGSTVERRIETEPVNEPSSSKPAPPPPKSDSKDAKPLSGMTMLVAEDHMVMQKLTRAKLSSLGVDTVFCENGEETLKSVQEALRTMPEADQDGTSKRFPYDAILMDCQMPVMDGFEAARLIRLEEKGYGMHIPIIALTGHASNEESTKIYQAGMDHHLVKPLQVDQLLEAIRSTSMR